jgi:hypothetical protein
MTVAATGCACGVMALSAAKLCYNQRRAIFVIGWTGEQRLFFVNGLPGVNRLVT